MNTYYVGRLLGSDDEDNRAIGNAIGILFPNQETTGTHVNISGAGLMKHAPNPQEAVQFLEFMTSEEAQRILADGNNEYPAALDVPAAGPIASFGDFREDEINATALGVNQPEAVQVYDRAGWP